MMFHWKYADERSTPQGQLGWLVTKIDNPDRATQIASVIDSKFENSSYETKTQTEQAFSASFASMLGNLNLLLGSVALAVVLTTLFVAGNTMAMSVRERTTEIAVMRTLGFPAATIFTLRWENVDYYWYRPFLNAYSVGVAAFILSRFGIALFYRPPRNAGIEPSVSVIITAM